MLDFLKLIRLPNLLIIAFTQYAMRYGIIYPMLKMNEMDLQLSNTDFFLLVLSTCLITAAGYIINDYFDVKIDSINRSKVIIGRSIKRRWAMALHIIFNIIAFILAFRLAYSIGHTNLCFIFAIAAGLLWYYSTNFKKQFIIGNIVVALLTACVPLLVGLFEIPLLYYKYGKIMAQFGLNFNFIAYFIIAYAGFAFLTTLVREIIKDTEDMKGDEAFDCETIPLKLGVPATKIILYILIGVIMSALGFIQFTQWKANDDLSFFYFLLLLQLPYAFMIYKIFKAGEKKDFSFLSKFNKAVMLAGLLYTLVIYRQMLYPAEAPPQEEVTPQLNINGGF